MTGSSVNPRGLRPNGPSGACSSTWCAASQSCPLTRSGIAGSAPAGAAVAHSSSVSDTATSHPLSATSTAARTPYRYAAPCSVKSRRTRDGSSRAASGSGGS